MEGKFHLHLVGVGQDEKISPPQMGMGQSPKLIQPVQGQRPRCSLEKITTHFNTSERPVESEANSLSTEVIDQIVQFQLPGSCLAGRRGWQLLTYQLLTL
jgi:hypothetical protein